MLFHDEPQSALPKRTAIKIYRYKTRDDELRHPRISRAT
jgi:hypothetical protein